MGIGKKMSQVALKVMETMLETEDVNDALSNGLEVLVNILESLSGALISAVIHAFAFRKIRTLNLNDIHH